MNTLKSAVLDRTELEKKNWNDPKLKLKVRWNGVNFYEFVLPGDYTIVMDPYFDDPNDDHNEHKYTPTDLAAGEWVHGADCIILTHGHRDHTGDLASVLEKYPEAQIILPEHAIPSVVVDQNIDYCTHYFTEAGAHDKFEMPGFIMETCRSNHNVAKGRPSMKGKAIYADENGNIDFFRLFNRIYEREIMNIRIKTEAGFDLLLWNSEMRPDGYGFETRRYFYRDAQPDLFMYQVAGASFGGDRRHPDCGPMGSFIASVKAKTALPEHQQHFSYEELDSMAEKFAAACDAAGVATSFLTPETGKWYGYTKDADGTVGIWQVEEDK